MENKWGAVQECLGSISFASVSSSGHLSISLDSYGWWFWEVKTHVLCCSGLWYSLSSSCTPWLWAWGCWLPLQAYSPFVSNVFGELLLCSSQDLPGYKKCTVWATAGWSYGPSPPTPVLIMFFSCGCVQGRSFSMCSSGVYFWRH